MATGHYSGPDYFTVDLSGVTAKTGRAVLLRV
jgi:hypothetical protein